MNAAEARAFRLFWIGYFALMLSCVVVYCIV